LGGELTHHLGYPPGGDKPDETTNHRTGSGSTTVLTDDGPLPIDRPRNRAGTFEPRLIGTHERRFAVADGLKGMSEALAAVFPQTTLQTCIVHLIRHSLDFAKWNERKPLAAALRPIYTAASAEAASAALDDFERGRWGANSRPTAQNAVSHSAHTRRTF
jgi:transposase-like protein